MQELLLATSKGHFLIWLKPGLFILEDDDLPEEDVYLASFQIQELSHQIQLNSNRFFFFCGGRKDLFWQCGMECHRML